MRPSFTRYGDQWPKFWMRPTFDDWVVDVDPVVGETDRLGHDERDGDEVAVAERVGRGETSAGGGGSIAAQKRADGHRRDHVGALVA